MKIETRLEQFVLEVEGQVHSLHDYFTDAVKAGLTIKDANPAVRINIRSLNDTSPRAAA